MSSLGVRTKFVFGHRHDTRKIKLRQLKENSKKSKWSVDPKKAPKQIGRAPPVERRDAAAEPIEDFSVLDIPSSCSKVIHTPEARDQGGLRFGVSLAEGSGSLETTTKWRTPTRW